MKSFKVLVLASLMFSITAVSAKPKLVEPGDTVKVFYTGKLKDGRVFDTNVGKEPLEFVAGSGQMIKGFDEAVIGMEKKDKKTVEISSADAYGPIDESKILEVEKARIPSNLDLNEGSKLTMQTAGGSLIVKVVKVTDEKVFVDANHMLAGKDLVFDIEMVSFEKPKVEKKS